MLTQLKKITGEKHLFLFIFIMFLIIPAFTQQSSTLFLMDKIPQANLVNPAIMPPCRFFIGMPVLSSFHFNLGVTGFSYNDIFSKAPGDSLKITPNTILNKAHNTDLVTTELYLNLLSFGFTKKKYYFTFNLNDKIDFLLTYPKDLMTMLWDGNSAFQGTTANLSSLRVNFNYYREYAFGVASHVNKKLTMGGRVKILFGKANLYTADSWTSLYVDQNTWANYLQSNALVNASLPVAITTNPDGTVKNISLQNINIPGFFLNRQNPGLGVDFGFVYKYNNKTTFSGSILDVGAIRWRSNYFNFYESGALAFSGTGYNSSFNFSNYVERLKDSMLNTFNLRYRQQKYFSPLVPNIYLGATYQFNRDMNLGLVSRTEIFKYWVVLPTVTASLNTNFSKHISLSLSWSYMDYAFNNIGLGMGLKFGTFNFHIVSDNVYGMMFYKGTQNVNIRFGFGFLFGCHAPAKVENLSNRGCFWCKLQQKKEDRFKNFLKRKKNKPHPDNKIE